MNNGSLALLCTVLVMRVWVVLAIMGRLGVARLLVELGQMGMLVCLDSLVMWWVIVVEALL